MSENNPLTRPAIKTLTFMSETCQVAAVGDASRRLFQSIYDGPLLAFSPTAIGLTAKAAATSAQGKRP
jgi:hypothetical protein